MHQLSINRLKTDTPCPFVSVMQIRNFKSIADSTVRLRALTAIVGRNGAGKSNFLDALKFVCDSLKTTLEQAIMSRGGIDEVRRRSTGHPRNFSINLRVQLSADRAAEYGFEIAAQAGQGFSVKTEEARIFGPGHLEIASYQVRQGQLIRTSSTTPMPTVAKDRLYLVSVSGLESYRPLYDGLTAMSFHNLNPAAMKALQSPDAGELLHYDGGNLASVAARLEKDEQLTERLGKYLEQIVPGVTGFRRISLGPSETLEFRQHVEGATHPWKFYAANMSDGTLRCLAALIATAQVTPLQAPVRLVGLEEPETAVHPAAAAILIAALREASEHTQVLVTSHSPELLDEIDPNTHQVLMCIADQGRSRLARIDKASIDAVKEGLYTLGELLSLDQLAPDPQELEQQSTLWSQLEATPE